MTKLENLLTILIEECGETAQRATKALRFTLEEIQPNLHQNPLQLNNAQRLIYEFNDICAVMEMLEDEGYLPASYDSRAMNLKKEKVKKYLELSQKLGTVE